MEINTFLYHLMQANNISTTGYALIEKNEITAFDTITTDTSYMVSSQSLFQACSISKVLTAYCVLLLTASNTIHLDLSVNAQLNDWKIPLSPYNNATVRQCLAMTSGLNYVHSNQQHIPYEKDMPVPTLQQILDGRSPATNGAIYQTAEGGIGYAYTGAGFMVLQQLITEISGQSFSQFVEKNILPLLNMNNSNLSCPLPLHLHHFAIPGFLINGQMIKGGWYNVPTIASGGLWSTPHDIAKLMLAISQSYLGNNGTIPNKLARETLTLQPYSLFGLGVAIDFSKNLNFRKVGYNEGYYSQLIMFPHSQQGLVIMTNSANGATLVSQFIEWIANKYNWPEYNKIFDEINYCKKSKHY